MQQQKTMEQIQDLLLKIYRYNFVQGESSVGFSEMISNLTKEEQGQFHQLINKLITKMK